MKDKVTTKLSNNRLKPLIEYARTHRGTIKDLLKLLNKRTGKKWNRENLDRWLHQNPEKRIQPLFGVGLLLVEIGDEYMAKNGNGNNTVAST